MANRNTQIKGSQIVDAIAGSGMRKGSDENLYIGVDDSTIQLDSSNDWIEVKDGGITETQLNASVAGQGLTGGGGSSLSVNVDDSTIEISTDILQVKDSGITYTKLNTIAAPADGEILSYNGTSGQMQWKSLDSIGVNEGDFKYEDLTASCDGSKIVFNLANIPVTNSLQVFLNGLIQQRGVGEDYNISGNQAIQFAIAPDSNDILTINYVEQD